jgi:hypothetical protein
MEFLKSGKVGKIGMVRTFAHAAGGPGTKSPDSDPPAGMDWDLWLGPAPARPFNKAIHPRGFRQFSISRMALWRLGRALDGPVAVVDRRDASESPVHSTRAGSYGQDSTDAPTRRS